MDLTELLNKTLELLNVKNANEITEKLFDVVKDNINDIYEKFSELVSNDLSKDWLQQIYQYYLADRKEKKQDYTPVSLARLTGMLAGESEQVIDMCAGSGALTIQMWNLNHNAKFELYELDENVIPFLLFNMAVRNIECIVYHADILSEEIFNTFKIKKGIRFGKLEVVNESVDIESTI